MILKSDYHRLDLTRQAGFIVTVYDEDRMRLAATIRNLNSLANRALAQLARVPPSRSATRDANNKDQRQQNDCRPQISHDAHSYNQSSTQVLNSH